MPDVQDGHPQPSGQRLVDSAEVLSRTFEYAPDAKLLVDEEGLILRVNRQGEHIFGYDRKELIGQPVEILIPGRFVGGHVAHRRGYMASPRLRPMGAGVDLFAKRKDGSEVPVDILLTALDTPDGSVALAVVRDITEQKRAEARFRDLLESAPDAMVIVDDAGAIVLVNSQTESLFGYRRDQLLGQPVEILIPERYHAQHTNHRSRFFHTSRVRPMGAGLELFGRRENGTEFPVEISLSPIHTEEGQLVSSAIRDITDRKLVEEQLRASLREKETLLQEIHHRVKNNLAVIGSSFYLQSTVVPDAETAQILQACQDRVRSMALVHERLYHSGNFAQIDLAKYVEDLARDLVATYAVGETVVSLTFDLETFFIPLDRAVPLALMLNEVMTNALKHAFPDQAAGTIRVWIRTNEHAERELGVSDDGVGMEEGRESSQSFGMKLLASLARQVDGTLEFGDASPGTAVTITLQPESGDG